MTTSTQANQTLYEGFHTIKKVTHPKFPERVFEQMVMPDAVGGLIITRDGFIPLVKQFRPAVGQDTLELPAGICDKQGLSPERTLFEELQEELGFTPEMCRDLRPIQPVNQSTLKTYMMIGSTNAIITMYAYRINMTKQQIEAHLFETTGRHASPQTNDDVDQVVWVPLCRENDLSNELRMRNQPVDAQTFTNLIQERTQTDVMDMKTMLFVQHISRLLEQQNHQFAFTTATTKPRQIHAIVATHEQVVHTLEGDVVAQKGDFIVTGKEGDTYPVSRDTFRASYDEVPGLTGVFQKKTKQVLVLKVTQDLIHAVSPDADIGVDYLNIELSSNKHGNQDTERGTLQAFVGDYLITPYPETQGASASLDINGPAVLLDLMHDKNSHDVWVVAKHLMPTIYTNYKQ